MKALLMGLFCSLIGLEAVGPLQAQTQQYASRKADPTLQPQLPEEPAARTLRGIEHNLGKLNQQVSVHLTDVTIEQALEQIAGMAELKFVTAGRPALRQKKISLDLQETTVLEALYAATQDVDTRLMISPSGFLIVTMGTGATEAVVPEDPEQAVPVAHAVSGTVTAADDGSLLPGVNIVVKGTTIGTTTNVDGVYTLEAPSPEDTLVFTYVGFQSQEVPIQGRSVIDVVLEADDVALDEVVVVGYTTQRQRDLSGAITTVDADRLNPISTVSINQMMQGKAPGFNLQTRSAQPGGGVSANIRGAISPNGNNTPLYVIDGVPITEYSSSVPGLNDGDLGFHGGVDRDPLSYLNPSDIETITVLKDASATAIYGSAAANGVVLITTRSGRVGNVQATYRGSYTAETPHEYFPIMNARQFMEAQSRLAYERYLYENNLQPYGSTDPADGPAYTPLFTQEQINAAGEGTDWLGLVTESGYAQEHNLTLRGGAQNTRAYASFNYRGNDAVLRGSTLNRYSGRLNLDQTITDAIHLSVKMSATRLDGDNASTGTNSGGPEKFNMLQAAYAYTPVVPVMDEQGNYTYSHNRTIMNPAAFLTILDDSRTTTLFATPNLEIDFSDHLKANVVGQVNQEMSVRSFYLPRRTNNDVLQEGMAQKSENNIHNYSAESYLTYSNEFGDSELTVVGGVGYYKAATEGFSVQSVGFFTDAFGYNNIGVASDDERDTQSSWKSSRTKLSQFARINYTLRDRYIVSLVGRRDGSSIFSEEHKYGFFPGASAAWILSEEDFLQGIPQLTQLKLRAGYGLAGNESILSGNTLQLYSAGDDNSPYRYIIGNTLYTGIALSQVANPFLTWETVSTFNLGLDFGLWSNRLRGSVDYFVKTAHDLLDFNPLPANNPVGRVADNVGSTRSRGIEVALHTLNAQSPSFEWSTDLSVAYYKSHWVERNPQVPLAPYVGETDPLDAIYGWETAGIIRSDADRPDYMPDANLGNLIYVDQNGDGELNDEDVVILGNSTPRWTIGFNNTISWRNFDLNVFVYGNLDYLRGNTYAPYAFGISQLDVPENTTVYARDIWSSTNTDGTYPGIADNPYDNVNPAGNDFTLEEASFLRLRNVSLGYALPQRWTQWAEPLRTARLFLNVQNLGVLTNYPGFDPEYTETNPYPKYYSTTLGVELSF